MFITVTYSLHATNRAHPPGNHTDKFSTRGSWCSTTTSPTSVEMTSSHALKYVLMMLGWLEFNSMNPQMACRFRVWNPHKWTLQSCALPCGLFWAHMGIQGDFRLCNKRSGSCDIYGWLGVKTHVLGPLPGVLQTSRAGKSNSDRGLETPSLEVFWESYNPL